MGAPHSWLALATAITLINGATISYLAWRERSRALWLWSVGWFAWAAAVIPLMLLRPSAEFSPIFLVTGLLWVASSLALLAGGYQLVGRKVPRGWYGVAAVAAVAAVALAVAQPGTHAMAPLALFQCTALVTSGASMLRNARRRTGAWLYGLSLVVLGLHVLDAPLVMRFPVLVPWGFVLALSLEFVAALGMVVLHYEHALARLLEAERALGSQRRLDALGRVAGGVAHDFNNLLTVLQGQLELLRSEAPASELARDAVGTIEQVAERASRLTRQLLAFGRRAETQPTRVDVREVVEATIALLRKLVPKSIQLELHCSDGDHMALLDRALLEQIVLNLVTNARDAISDSGKINVELVSGRSPESALVLRVRDDGAGMDDELLSQIFEPFFTTKGNEHGTGLGLASVDGAVSQLGGQIRVDSKPGKGSTFEVSLPRTAKRT